MTLPRENPESTSPKPAHPAPAHRVMDFLLSRRSRPVTALKAPAPDAETLTQILTAASRVPDHGKLEPWRFVVVEGAACRRLSALAHTRGAALGMDPEKVTKAARIWANAPLVVAVVLSPKPLEKVPEFEQTLSVGAVCLSLVNAALASGWGAAWITGWTAFDRGFVQTGLGLAAHERIAGYVHLGHCETPVPERTRPDIRALTQWLRA